TNRVRLILRPFRRADEEILVCQEATVELLMYERLAVNQSGIAQAGAEHRLVPHRGEDLRLVLRPRPIFQTDSQAQVMRIEPQLIDAGPVLPTVFDHPGTLRDDA